MTGLVITGWSALCAAGVGAEALSDRVCAGTPVVRDASGLFEEPLPAAQAPVLVDFDVRQHLGRKGTSFYDRATALAVVACGAALRDGDVVVDDLTRTRIGVVLGTTLGSFKSTSDYTRDTLVQEKPYLVNPVLFPNTVMNCAAGQAAIRFGLRGVNATVAGGPLAFHHALRYAGNVLYRDYAETMVVGAVEEYSPHRAWNSHLTARGERAGEGAAAFVVERIDAPRGPARPPVAEVLAVTTGFGWQDAAAEALTGCVRRALHASGVNGSEVSLVVTGELAGDERSQYAPAVAALWHDPERLAVSAMFGDCDAALGALGLAAMLARLAADHPSAGVALLTARTRDGGVGAAVVRRCR
jgi:3-oxoacyl-[acyl-carrier-protein] synthase II